MVKTHGIKIGNQRCEITEHVARRDEFGEKTSKSKTVMFSDDAM